MTRQKPDIGHWTPNDIPYHAIEHDRLAGQDQLFFQVAAASFIEITSDVFTRNLQALFDGDPEVQDWLTRHWEPEELQHGTALRRYVHHAWPEFDWDAAYRGFYDEYAATCQMDALEPTLTQELVARCVVEMGTATGYRLLETTSPEPVLAALAGRIKADEVRHYKYFYRFFRRYREQAGMGRLPVLHTLYARLHTVDGEDAYYAFKHVYRGRYPRRTFGDADYEHFRRQSFRLARSHYPYDMGMKMLLRPLDLNHRVERAAAAALKLGLRHALRH